MEEDPGRAFFAEFRFNRTVLNLIRQAAKRIGRQGRLERDGPMERGLPGITYPEPLANVDETEVADIRMLVRAALPALPEEHARAIMLRFYQDLPVYDEEDGVTTVASELGRSERHTYRLLEQARAISGLESSGERTMTSSEIGPGVERFRELRARGEQVDAAAITREYPGEALALADEVRRTIEHDTLLTHEHTWLARIKALRDAGEDVGLGTSIRNARIARGLTVVGLARSIRAHGVAMSAAELRRIEANEVDVNVEPEIWPVLSDEMDFEPYSVITEIRVALSDAGAADSETEAYLERVRAGLGLPAAVPGPVPDVSPAPHDDEELAATARRDALVARLAESFGAGASWDSGGNEPARVWSTAALDVVLHGGGTDSVLRRAWEARKGLGARPVILLSAAEDDARVRVCGPQHPRPIRELPVKRVLALLDRASSLHFNEAASVLAREFIRIEESALPGLRVKELLTPHFVRERLTASREQLEHAIEGVSNTAAAQWNPLFRGLGYRIEQLPERGHILRDAAGSPVAVLHPLADADSFGRLTLDGTLPEGLLLAACDQHGARWGVLASNGPLSAVSAASGVWCCGRAVHRDRRGRTGDREPLRTRTALAAVTPRRRLACRMGTRGSRLR